MSKKKRFHQITNTRQQAKAYAFMHRAYPYGSVRGVQKKTAPSAANTESGKVEQNLTGTVSTSHDTREMEETQV